MQPFQSSRNSRSWSSYGAARARDCSEIQPPPETGLMKEYDVSSCFYYLLDDPFFDRDLAGVPDPPPAPPDAHFPPPIGDFSPPFQSNQHYSYHSFNSLASPISRLPESGSSDTCELILTSLSGEDPVTLPTAGDRKRKGKELANDAISEYHGEESGGHGSAKRSRAAEVRNLSVRRRRNRINEKMRALQELVPRCGKTDKASMLDEAIEYFKSLQMQVQMMSIGCGMVPMMVLGVQQYMPQMGMNQSATQFPALPTQFPVENLPLQNVSATDPSRIQPSNQVDSFLGSQGASSADPYLQFLGEDQPDFIASARK